MDVQAIQLKPRNPIQEMGSSRLVPEPALPVQLRRISFRKTERKRFYTKDSDNSKQRSSNSGPKMESYTQT
jgi:hypothetical protein